MTLSIVIPVLNRYDLTAKLLLQLRRFDVDEVVVVDDGSKDTTTKLPQIFSEIVYVRFPINRGFPIACNVGVDISTGDSIILMNNDVEVRGDFVSKTKSHLEDNVLIGAQLFDHDTGWNTFNGTTIPYLAGWFLSFTRRTWDRLGGFDRRYAPADYEDVDLSYAARWKGVDIQEVELPLTHIGGQSAPYNSKRRAITERNRVKFAEKWDLQLSEART